MSLPKEFKALRHQVISYIYKLMDVVSNIDALEKYAFHCRQDINSNKTIESQIKDLSNRSIHDIILTCNNLVHATTENIDSVQNISRKRIREEIDMNVFSEKFARF